MTKKHCGTNAGHRSYLFDTAVDTSCFGSKRSQVRILSPRPLQLTRIIRVYLGERRSDVSPFTPVFTSKSGFFWASIAGELGDCLNSVSPFQVRPDLIDRAVSRRDSHHSSSSYQKNSTRIQQSFAPPGGDCGTHQY